MILRSYRSDDRQRCEEIFAATRHLAHPHRPASDVPEEFEAATRDEEIWIAESAGGISGWVSIYLSDHFIHHLYVDPGQLHRGIGRALLDRAVARCGGSVDLKCNEANRAAHHLYVATGLRPAGWGWAPTGPWIRFRR